MRKIEKTSSDSLRKCEWAVGDPLLAAYHDTEWGAPEHDDRKLFEFLVLESMQAGLSWLTVLRKREAFRKAFDGFDPEQVARYDSRKVRSLLSDAGIVRNKAKIAAAIRNATSFLEVQKEFGSFDSYIWRFEPHGKKKRPLRKLSQIPARTKESDLMSEDLKKRGFTFVGSTICYAYMQAIGMVNDHLAICFRSGAR